MKKRWLLIAAFGLCLVFAGCEKKVEVASSGNTQTEHTESEETQEETSQPSLSPEEAAMLEYETKLAGEGLTAQEYGQLAQLYGQADLVKRQRDLLEQSWRLYGEMEDFTALQGLTVNAREESQALQDQAQLLMQNLDISQYWNEAAAVVYSQDWFDIMMPRLKEGRRNYYYEDSHGKEILVWQTGYSLQGQPYTNAWYLQGEEMILLQQTPERIRLLTAGYSEGNYQGVWESWTCLSDTGSVYHETGTLADNVLTGEYTVQAYRGKEPVDLIGLWGTRADMKFTDYTGSFAENGTIALEQPQEKLQNHKNGAQDGMSQIIYAYTKDEKNYLFLNVPEETEVGSLVFDTALLKIPAYPEFRLYEPTLQEEPAGDVEDKQINARDVQVRVFDGNLEWFDGTRWYVLGPIEDYLAKDPLLTYSGRVVEGISQSEDASGSAGAFVDAIGNGSIKQQTTNKPSSKPSGSQSSTQPSVNTTPATPPSTPPAETTPTPPSTPPAETTPTPPSTPPAETAPTQPSTPPEEATPTPPDAGSGSDPGTQTPPSSGGSGDSGSSDAGNSGDNETDIEWSDDIL